MSKREGMYVHGKLQRMLTNLSFVNYVNNMQMKAFSSTHFFHTFQPSLDKNVVQLDEMPSSSVHMCTYVVSPGYCQI